MAEVDCKAAIKTHCLVIGLMTQYRNINAEVSCNLLQQNAKERSRCTVWLKSGLLTGHKRSNAEMDCDMHRVECKGAIQNEDGPWPCSTSWLLHQPGCSPAEDVRAFLGAFVWQSMGQGRCRVRFLWHPSPPCISSLSSPDLFLSHKSLGQWT